MKQKSLAMLLAILLAFQLSVPITAYAYNSPEEINLSEQQNAALESNLKMRNLWGQEYNSYILYNNLNEPKFIFGVTDEGYVILDRDTFEFHEAGNSNPYYSYHEAKKYYGGPLQYFVSEDSMNTGMMKDIVKNIIVSSFDQAQFKSNQQLKSNKVHYTEGEIAEISSLVRAGSITTKVSNSYNYIRRKAHGYNDDSTCSAVAVGIALNYLTITTGKKFVPLDMRSENYDKGRPVSAADTKVKYPKAYKLHRTIVDDFGMGMVSYAEGIRVPFTNYVKKHVSDSYNLKLSWTLFPRFSTIKSNLLSNKPVLVTTTFAGDYSWHTMVAYGCRTIGTTEELLVHTGWYSSSYNSLVSGTKYSQNETWIGKGYATYGYYFSYN